MGWDHDPPKAPLLTKAAFESRRVATAERNALSAEKSARQREQSQAQSERARAQRDVDDAERRASNAERDLASARRASSGASASSAEVSRANAAKADAEAALRTAQSQLQQAQAAQAAGERTIATLKARPAPARQAAPAPIVRTVEVRASQRPLEPSPLEPALPPWSTFTDGRAPLLWTVEYSQVPSSTPAKVDERIAIVGYSCILPGGASRGSNPPRTVSSNRVLELSWKCPGG